ncbi:hypothetical protein D3C76_1262730 [compost metagenome]
MSKLRIRFHFVQCFFIATQAEYDLNTITPLCKIVIDNLIAYDAPSTRHNKHGRYIIQLEFFTNDFLTWVFPKVGVYWNSRHLNVGWRNPTFHKLILHLWCGD